MARLTIEYTGLSADERGVLPPVTFEVEGADDAPFATAVWERLGSKYSPETFLLRLPSDITTAGPIVVSDKMTLGEVATFADGEVLRLTFSRVGGQWISELWTFASEGLTLLALIQLSRDLQTRAGRFTHRRHRDEARIWANHGVDSAPSKALTRLVKAQPAWPTEVFMSVFGLDRQEARALLVALGYAYDSAEDQWFEDAGE